MHGQDVSEARRQRELEDFGRWYAAAARSFTRPHATAPETVTKTVRVVIQRVTYPPGSSPCETLMWAVVPLVTCRCTSRQIANLNRQKSRIRANFAADGASCAHQKWATMPPATVAYSLTATTPITIVDPSSSHHHNANATILARYSRSAHGCPDSRSTGHCPTRTSAGRQRDRPGSRRGCGRPHSVRNRRRLALGRLDTGNWCCH